MTKSTVDVYTRTLSQTHTHSAYRRGNIITSRPNHAPSAVLHLYTTRLYGCLAVRQSHLVKLFCFFACFCCFVCILLTLYCTPYKFSWCWWWWWWWWCGREAVALLRKALRQVIHTLGPPSESIRICKLRQNKKVMQVTEEVWCTFRNHRA